MTKNHAGWWKLFAFALVACVALFSIANTDHSAFILWVIVVYAGIAIWLRDHYTYHPSPTKRPVEEFFDPDRLP